jgi:hypothetical protein
VSPGLWLALFAVLVAWIVYRAGQWNERQGVIRGLEAELKMHGQWVGKPYGEKDRGSWDPDYMVFKLSTVATDNAIARGPGLFLNSNLTVILVSYRQVVAHLNQIIDKTTDFQVVAELWRDPRPADQVTAAKQLVDSVHIQGIGDDSGLQQKPAAHFFFKQVLEQLRLENDSRALRVMWAITGLNLFVLRGWRAWLVSRLQTAWRLAVAGSRRVRRVASPPPAGPQPNLTPHAPEQSIRNTSHESKSFGAAVPFDITNITSANTSSNPTSSTSSWKEHARLPIAERQNPSEVAPQRATRRRKAK